MINKGMHFETRFFIKHDQSIFGSTQAKNAQGEQENGERNSGWSRISDTLGLMYYFLG